MNEFFGEKYKIRDLASHRASGFVQHFAKIISKCRGVEKLTRLFNFKKLSHD